MYCGVDVVVRQAVRLVNGNTSNLLELADSARAAKNHAEAIGFYNRVLENDAKNVRAWIGKGASAGWSSTLADFRFQEMFVALENAAKYADATKKPDVLKEAQYIINQVATACYQIARDNLIEFIELDNTWNNYLSQCGMILSALQVAHEYDPEDKKVIENVINLCKHNIEGYTYKDHRDNNIRKTVRVSDKYEAQLRALMNAYTAKLKKLNPSYEPPLAKRPSSGCFVVTATFNDENHPDVRLLRAFRDDILQHSTVGAAICSIYYKHGPKLAKAIAVSDVLKVISHKMAVAPAVFIARRILVSKRLAQQRVDASQSTPNS